MQPASTDGSPARMNIFVQPLDGSALVGEPRKLTSETARDISNFFWKGPDVVLYQKDFGGDENFHVRRWTPGPASHRPDALRQRARQHHRRPGGRSGPRAGHAQPARSAGLRRVPRQRAQRRRRAGGAQSRQHRRLADRPCRQRAAVASDGLNTTLLYRDDEAAEFRPLITTDYRTSVHPAFFTFDDKKLYAQSNRGRDKLALVVIDPARPDVEEEIYAPQEVDLDAAAYSRKRRVLTLAVYQTDKPQYKFFDAQTETLFKKLTAKLPGYDLALQGSNRDENKFIVAAYNDRTPGSRYLYDAASDTLSKLADLNPSLPESGMARVQPISYQSRDGLTIHGYLTLPAGRDPKNLACIVNPHGGPWRATAGLQPRSAILANRGFCVLQMNFRGSTGYGRRFWEAGFGQWGLKMQDDISDGVAGWSSRASPIPSASASTAPATATPRWPAWRSRRPVRGGGGLRGRVQPVHLHADHPALLEADAGQDAGHGGRPVRDKDRRPRPRRRCTRTASRRRCSWPRAPGSARQQGRKRPDGQGAEGARRQRGVHGQDNEGHGFHNDENKFEFYEAMEKFLLQHLAVVAFDPAGLAATAVAASAPPCAVQSQVAAAPKPTEPPVSTRSRPSSLARYNATSARARMPSAVSPRRCASRR